LLERYGVTLRLAAPSDTTSEHLRWPRLLEAFGTDAARQRIETFSERDQDLLARRPALHGPPPAALYAGQRPMAT
jgi:hypothetical protein